MFAKKIESQGSKVEMDWKGTTVEEMMAGYMEMANINQEMANTCIQAENEAEELLLSGYGD